MTGSQPPTRFVDDGAHLGDFRNRVLVHCPSCDGLAVVSAEEERPPILQCTRCGLQEDSRRLGRWSAARRGRWVGSGRQQCPTCGAWNAVRGYLPQDRDGLATRCTCGTPYVVEAGRLRFTAGDTDPCFGASLWLVHHTSKGVLWAYNERHLAWLQRFVAADLRERGDGAGNGTMAARLPAWVKSAKNRAVVLKAISRLQARLG